MRAARTPLLVARAAGPVVAATNLSGCSPMSAPGNVRLDGGAAFLVVTPPIGIDPQPALVQLVAPSTEVACEDGTGGGLCSARLTALSVHFPELGSSPVAGASGVGSGTIRWSDGSTSAVEVTVAFPPDGAWTVELSITSGTLVGRRASAHLFVGADRWSRRDAGISRFAVTFGSFDFAAGP